MLLINAKIYTMDSDIINNGFISVSLGDRVLRTETASLFVLSIINYIFMR